MKSTKRITALVLAGLMVLGTMGYIFSVMANAAEQTSNSIVCKEYTISGNATTGKIVKDERVTITFQLTGQSSADIAALNGFTTAEFNSNDNGFTSRNETKCTLTGTADSGSGRRTLTVENVIYAGGTNKKLSVNLSGGTATKRTITFDITECQADKPTDPTDPSDPGSGDGDKLPAGVINPRYSLEEVYTQSSSGNKTYYFNVNDGTNKDSSIKKGRLATIRAKVTDENGTVAGVNAAKASLDMGSFTGGSITIEGVTSYGDGVQYMLFLRVLSIPATAIPFLPLSKVIATMQNLQPLYPNVFPMCTRIPRMTMT